MMTSVLLWLCKCSKIIIENYWVHIKLIDLTVRNQNSDRGIEFYKQIISNINRSNAGRVNISTF